MVTQEQVKAISKELQPIMKRMGGNNPKKYERQTMYGDVLDWLRDMHPELRNKDYDDDFVAFYAIGDYVVHNCRL